MAPSYLLPGINPERPPREVDILSFLDEAGFGQSIAEAQAELDSPVGDLDPVGRVFGGYELTKPNKASKPLRLPIKAPACFRDQVQWDLYRKTSNYTGADGHTFCTDCTPTRRDAMAACGRCKFPNTTFRVIASGITIGTRRR